MQDAKEEVRSRLAIEDVIGEYVQLKRAGRSFRGLSPFGSEKTPSFYVSPDKQIWHDFSSGRGGDIFSFVMEVEGMGFREALELLARKAGVEIEQYRGEGGKEVAERKKRLLSALDSAANYYSQMLLRTESALSYVRDSRKLTGQTVTEFRIGYAPDSGRALTNYLTKKGYSATDLADAGLSNRFGGDLFRGRITIPLMDGQGQVVGFTARILKDEPEAPKYLNTPSTILYDKSRHVFGLHLAKDAIRTADYAVLVEGNMDVVASHQVGVRPVVATAGTALTEGHLRALMRLSGNVRLSFDADKAGLNATERAIPIAQALDVNLSIITIGDKAKDPDELIAQGVEKWRAVIDQAVPAVDWVIERYKEREDLTAAEGKRHFTSAALELIARLKDPVEAEHYMNLVATMTGTTLEALRSKKALQKATEDRPLKPVQAAVLPQAQSKVDATADNLLALAVLEADVRALLKPDLTDLLEGDRATLARYLGENTRVALDPLPNRLKEIEMYGNIIVLRADARYGSYSHEDRIYEAARLSRQLKTQKNTEQKTRLLQELREAEEQHDEQRADALRQKLNTLIKETK
jgi:DNA primase